MKRAKREWLHPCARHFYLVAYPFSALCDRYTTYLPSFPGPECGCYTTYLPRSRGPAVGFAKLLHSSSSWSALLRGAMSGLALSEIIDAQTAAVLKIPAAAPHGLPWNFSRAALPYSLTSPVS